MDQEEVGGQMGENVARADASSRFFRFAESEAYSDLVYMQLMRNGRQT